MSARAGLPSGAVTFLFTDIEGSTALLHEIGSTGYAAALAEHRRLLRAAFTAHGGVEVDTQGDAFFVAFTSAPAGVAAAAEGQRALADGPIQVRMGLHTGQPALTAEGYVGVDVHLGARIAAAGHGGQVLLSPTTRALIDGDVTDLGEHRLKDFDQPVAICQLGTGRFPPLKTISNTNLPRPVSSFIGRQAELSAVIGLLRGPSRLVTLLGPGGTGKTRLAIEAAIQVVAEFKAGVFWVPLATLRDPALVSEAIGQVVGASGSLSEHVREREMLLVVDNLEQIIGAGGDLSQLLEACPNLRLLVTSRERLAVRGEATFQVPTLVDADAVALFCSRSGRGRDERVDELCRRLDNLPLAIELAAARARMLTPSQILDRLGRRLDLFQGGRDADVRQRTLRAAIHWSYELLTLREQELFARLAVFAGGCTLDDAEAVVDADLDDMQSLVDKSLLQQSSDRFWMLETIREYAVERLESTSDASVWRGRFAEHFLALAQEAAPWTGEFQPDAGWLDRLAAEHDNLRAALDLVETSGDSTRQLQFVNALCGFWGQRGFLSEGWRHVERALHSAPDPTPDRARALIAAADLGGLAQGDAHAVQYWASEALTLYRRFGDGHGAAEALVLLGHAAADLKDYEQARQLAEEALALAESLGAANRAAYARWLLSWAYGGLGDADSADRMLDEALGQARAAGDLDFQALILYSRSAHALTAHGRPAQALAAVTEGHYLARDARNPWRTVLTAGRLAWVLAHLGAHEAAVRVFASVNARLEEMGGKAEHRADEDRDILERTRTALEPETFAAAWESGQRSSVEDVVDAALRSVSATHATSDQPAATATPG